MRIDAEFAQKRDLDVKKIKKKFFLISEGSKSEPIYFRELNNNLITKNIDIFNILRDKEEVGNSHPKYLYELSEEFRDNIKYSIKLEDAKFFINQNSQLDDIIIQQIIEELEMNYDNDELVKTVEVQEILNNVIKINAYESIMNDFENFIEHIDTTYDSILDEICIIADRDRKSFRTQQFLNIAEKCRLNNIGFYVTNPCFEFWLLMHFDIINTLDKSVILANEWIDRSNNIRYLTKLLDDTLDGGYDKVNFNFSEFEKNISKAISNSQNFKTDIKNLENNLGTNLGLLVKKMLDESID